LAQQGLLFLTQVASIWCRLHPFIEAQTRSTVDLFEHRINKPLSQPEFEEIRQHLPEGSKRESTALLTKLYIAPELQGQGLGKKLISTLLDAARDPKKVNLPTGQGYEQVVLRTRDEMQAAISLYRRLGFEPLLYDPATHVHWMRKSLTPPAPLKADDQGKPRHPGLSVVA
jgi:GNAT superfamily N-acetyltransferase